MSLARVQSVFRRNTLHTLLNSYCWGRRSLAASVASTDLWPGYDLRRLHDPASASSQPCLYLSELNSDVWLASISQAKNSAEHDDELQLVPGCPPGGWAAALAVPRAHE